jgi:hypothetical protein
MPHVEATHTAVPLTPPGQARPHTPQCVALARTSTSQPLVGLPSQSPKPIAQRREHVPAEHTAVALGPVGHIRPQAPQWLLSVFKNTSQPLLGLPSQSPKPGLQVKPQRPAMQVRAALGTMGQVLPQAPQSVTSRCRSAQEAPQRVSEGAQPEAQA